MTINDLIDCLFEVIDKEQEITTDDICEIVALWERCKGIDSKIVQLHNEKVSPGFISGWQKEKSNTLQLIRNYKSR